MDFVLKYLTAAGIFVACDAIWLSLMVKRFYRPNMEHLLAASTNFIAAAVFYGLYIIGIIFFAVNPAIDKNSIGYAAGAGALLGLLMYATYDLTNLSTLKGWPLNVTIVDMLWGTFVTALVATITYKIFN